MWAHQSQTKYISVNGVVACIYSRALPVCVLCQCVFCVCVPCDISRMESERAHLSSTCVLLSAGNTYKASPLLFSVGGTRMGGATKLGSGRSPLVRWPTPLNPTLQKRSKSVSPSHGVGRLSPFSQTVQSRSWTTLFSEDSAAVSLEPLLPQMCMQKLLEMPGK